LPASEASLNGSSLAREAAAIEEAVREAGAVALSARLASSRNWRKADGTPVSDADLAVNRLLEERLRDAFPDYGWLSEETGDSPERLERERIWVIDPIDGTSAFLSGDSGWCIAVALVEHARPVAAGVYRPVSDQYFAAERGAGARLDGRPIHVSRREALEGASLVVKPRVLKLDIWQRPWPQVKTAMTPSIALRLCAVACGKEDGTFGLGAKSDWDLAAGDLIVHEAGGRMSDLDGRTMRFNRPETRQNGFLAAGAGIFEALKAQAGARSRN
jgi:myo-inositol-1(or 4)-monophosphatase